MWRKHDTEESWTDSKSMEYHEAQWDNPKESTKDLEVNLKSWLNDSGKVIDIGCGAGAVTTYLATRFPDVNFLGIDKESLLIKIAREKSAKLGLKNVSFDSGNIYKLPKNLYIDGVILTQTILLFKDYKKPMTNIFRKLKPRWVAVTGLFYDGEISLYATAHEYKKNRTVNLNTYSINQFNNFCEKNKFRIALNQPFEIQIDLEKPTNPDFMGTYTEKIITKNGDTKRIQISGPLLQNWKTIVLENTEL
jgi:SAM-dependent methyltransferase